MGDRIALMKRLVLAALLTACASPALAEPTPKDQLLVPPTDARHFVVVSTAGKHGDEYMWKMADGRRAFRESIHDGESAALGQLTARLQGKKIALLSVAGGDGEASFANRAAVDAWKKLFETERIEMNRRTRLEAVDQMEDAFERIKQQSGPIPHTINFVSGPSRTGDIEQTLELGAHGPKALAVLIVKG